MINGVGGGAESGALVRRDATRCDASRQFAQSSSPRPPSPIHFAIHHHYRRARKAQEQPQPRRWRGAYGVGEGAGGVGEGAGGAGEGGGRCGRGAGGVGEVRVLVWVARAAGRCGQGGGRWSVW